MAELKDIVGSYVSLGSAGVFDSLDRKVGIEIEVENVTVPILAGKPEEKWKATPGLIYWATVKDNSLRNNGVEFVSKPLPISNVAAAVFELLGDFCWTTHKGSWKASVRTGIHVHVDVRDFNSQMLRNLMVVYALVEPALFSHVGQWREECIYCVPWYRAKNDAKMIAAALDTDYRGTKLHHLTANQASQSAKYSALNMAPMFRIGTVEFRMAPTWLEAAEVVRWARICERVVSYASKCGTYYNALDSFENDPSAFVRDVCPGMKVPRNYRGLADSTGSVVLAHSFFTDTEQEGEWTRIVEDIEDFGRVVPKPSNIYGGLKPKKAQPKVLSSPNPLHYASHVSLSDILSSAVLDPVALEAYDTEGNP